jgi:tRNA threonylcarbamoyladenosine biosynthesis protein TsaB
VIILGFDTSTRATVVGLRLADGSALQARDDPAPGEHPGHATRLLEMAHELRAQAGISWETLDRIAVGLGPGRFTGLRVGIATARGLAQSLSVELVGVSTLRAIAQAAIASDRGNERVLAVIDALRGEAFAGGYCASGRQALCELEIPTPLGPDALAEAVASSGEQRRPWLAVGDGAVRYRSVLESAGAKVPPDSSELHDVDARSVCDLAARSDSAPSYQELVPDYRRRPDAERRVHQGGEHTPAGELQAAVP